MFIFREIRQADILDPLWRHQAAFNPNLGRKGDKQVQGKGKGKAKEGTGKWKRGRDGNSINGVVWCQSKIVTSMRQRSYKKGICTFEVDRIRA